ncbi:MAG: efflux RND transporter permease subunit, partial [Azonexus sp.]
FVTFRDMGLAFGVALVLIYMLVVAEFRNFLLPAVVMAPIPLTLIGIIPGHWLLGADFTATSMIGFIALAGIIVRNSILLVDFAKGRVEEGMSVRDAVVLAAEVRMRPIVITALALVIGSTVLLSDPIFQGMAVSLLFGSIVATFLTLVVIPLGCLSGRKAFRTMGDDGECPLNNVPPPNNNPSGGAPSSGGDAAGGTGGGSTAGRPPRLAKRDEPATGMSETSVAPPPVAGRPPRLAKKTETEALAAVAEAAPATTGGRPPRLEKRSDTTPAAEPAVAAAGGRPPRLEKRSTPQAFVEAPVIEAPPVVEAKEKPAPVKPPAPAKKKPEVAKPAAAKAKPVTVAPPQPEVAAVKEVRATAAQPVVPAESAREPVSSRKRKLRGIRIKVMDEGSDES